MIICLRNSMATLGSDHISPIHINIQLQQQLTLQNCIRGIILESLTFTQTTAIDDCYMGVPVVLGKNGIEKFIEVDLNEEEQADLQTSRGHVKEVMAVLYKLN